MLCRRAKLAAPAGSGTHDSRRSALMVNNLLFSSPPWTTSCNFRTWRIQGLEVKSPNGRGPAINGNPHGTQWQSNSSPSCIAARSR